MTSATPSLTTSLALVAGLYMLAGGVALCRMGDRLGALIDEFEASSAVSHLSGLVIFAVGVAMVLSHNLWTGALTGFISLLGWIGAIKGLLLIAWPAPIWRIGRWMSQPSIVIVFKFSIPVLGLLLILVALTGSTG